jgi:putative FmdB family regulatory protein
MPTYDFTCDTCKKTEEHKFPIDEDTPVLTCECGGTMRKQFVFPASLTYKGKGWAKKDRKAERK